jgi:cytochrome oxidase Cu insertion factor (SCO1/SenC/PrrC family)
MARKIIFLLAIFCISSPSIAQPGRRGGDRLEQAGLAVGQTLPEAQLFTGDGRPFSLSELKGSYTVLIFGCLT